MEFASETNADTAEVNGSLIHFIGKHKSLNSRKSEYDKVSVSDIQKFASRIANEESFNIVAVGKNIDINDLKQFKQKTSQSAKILS